MPLDFGTNAATPPSAPAAPDKTPASPPLMAPAAPESALLVIAAAIAYLVWG